MKEQRWQDTGGLLLALIGTAAAAVFYSFTTFATRADVEDVKQADSETHRDFVQRLQRIEDKVDRLHR